MTDHARSGEAGYWARRVQYARDLRLASAGPPMPARRDRARDLDPHTRPPAAHELAGEELRLADETPGRDESHTMPGHPSYQPKGTR